MAQGALAGIRVVELGEGVSAPFCGRLFADYGADVVKVEPPGGDVARRLGPFPRDEPHPEKSGLFFFLNAGKRGVALDPAAEGREALRGLLASADVVVENLAGEALRSWRLDPAAEVAARPGLVWISITPFGRTGPYADWKARDLNAYHLSAAGHRYCGRPGEPPLEHGTFSAEFFGGYVAAAWGLGGVLGAARTGGGHLDVSCAEAIAALFTGAQNVGALAQDGKWERRSGVGMRLGAPATILPCKDGHVWMLALEPGQWNGLRRAMGDPEWAEPEMWQDMFARGQDADVLYPLIESWTLEHTKQEVMDLCQANGCPTTALFTVAEVAELPHLRERGFWRTVSHPVLGEVRTLGPPVRLPACPGGASRAAPLLGEHRAEVLAEASDARLRRAPVQPAERALPLAGVRVANFGWGWLGPVAGQTLAWLGAEVYKIESRARIDLNRTLPPYGGGVRDPDRSLQNHAGWAGNGSVTIDLKHPAGVELARRLVARCDVAIENFGPGVMEKLGLGYGALRAARPDLILASMPAAGLTGPLEGIRTYGMSLSSIAGLDSLTGYCGGPPIPVENAFADPLGGVIGAFGVLLALAHRERTGEGQHVDFSQQEGVAQLVAPALMDYLMNGRVAGPMGNRHPLAAGAPHGVFPCAGDDRWVSIAVVDDAEWRELVRAMGGPAWADDPALATARGRAARSDDLHERVAAWTRPLDDRELAARLQAEGVPAAPVSSVEDLLRDPHLRARGTFVEVEHPLGFRETIYGAYVKTSGFSVSVRPGPCLGQDNERVLREIVGLGEAEYRRLVDDKVVF
jgi:benzylsuccinate CoA-transferase BbsF subunit